MDLNLIYFTPNRSFLDTLTIPSTDSCLVDILNVIESTDFFRLSSLDLSNFFIKFLFHGVKHVSPLLISNIPLLTL